ncbi:MAG: phosphatidylglycerophosphatase A [Phycisphaerales bacterium]|nr:phosphatidylglycerophosphatase A [Phycisphaerales bacterium]
MTDLRSTMLTVFGLGNLPGMPGTFGSLPVVAIALCAVIIGSPTVMFIMMLLLLIVASAITVICGDWAEEKWKRTDPGCVVSDEVAGQALAYLIVPWMTILGSGDVLSSLLLIITGFITFRLLDILKPPPINQLQSLHGGWGILADDLLAGLGAGLLTWIMSLALLAM